MVEQAANRSKRILIGCSATFVIVVTVIMLWLYPVYATFRDEGFLDEQEMRVYSGTTSENLKAIHQALLLYHDSEGQYPQAEGWMDAAWLRLKTADMEEAEAKKKLQSPGMVGMADQYGYAFNQALSGKFVDDIKDPDNTVLIFDSSNTDWNAHGDPKKDAADPARPGGNMAVTVSGRVAPLSELLTPTP